MNALAHGTPRCGITVLGHYENRWKVDIDTTLKAILKQASLVPRLFRAAMIYLELAVLQVVVYPGTDGTITLWYNVRICDPYVQ